MHGTCADCGERATCEYDWGLGLRKACAAHDPLRWPYGATMARVPQYYRTLAFPVPVTTGTGLLPDTGGTCTCTMFGLGTARCPVHQSYRSQVWC